jgi:hypothetical protein
VVQSATALADHGPARPAAPATVTVAEVRDDLLKLFGSVPDGRSGQGRDHPVAAVLALAAAAVVAGMKGYTAIVGWVKDVPPPVLADLYLRAGAAPAPPPSKAKIWRVVTDADAEMFDATVGSWLMSGLLAGPAAQDGDTGAGPDDLAQAVVNSAAERSGACCARSRMSRSGCENIAGSRGVLASRESRSSIEPSR